MNKINEYPRLAYKELVPLINLLLFNSTDSSIFIESKGELSYNFSEAIFQFQNSDIKYKEYLSENIKRFLSSLDDEGRSRINEIVTLSEIFSYMLFSWNLFAETNDKNAALKQFVAEMEVFMETSEIGYFYNLFFIFQIEEIFAFDFKNSNNISIANYYKILKTCCNPKSVDNLF